MLFPFRSNATLSRRVLLIIALLGVAVPASFAAKKTTVHKELSDTEAYRGAIVMDAATGKVLIEDRADEVGPPASMTKLMTYAVLYDKLASGQIKLDTPVQIDRADAGQGGTQVFLDPRETFPVEELVYAMMIQSANDAAYALARFSAGSVPAFVEQMNAKAREIGMTHTTFRTPNGLPPTSRRISEGDLTTPRDFALLCRYLLLRTDVLKYTSIAHRDFGFGRKQGPIKMDNHNKLLGKVVGVDGLKTGYTEGAGYCISVTGERNGRRLIVVIMGSFGPGKQIDKGKTRDRKAIELFGRGFDTASANTSDFSSERAKYVKPAVIALDSLPISSAGAAKPSVSSSPTSPPQGESPPSTDGPNIKLTIPHK